MELPWPRGSVVQRAEQVGGCGGGRTADSVHGRTAGPEVSICRALDPGPWQLGAVPPARSSVLGGPSPWLPQASGVRPEDPVSAMGSRPNRPDVPGDPPRSRANPGAFLWAAGRGPLGAAWSRRRHLPPALRGGPLGTVLPDVPAFSVVTSRGTTLETWAGGGYGPRVCDPEVHRPQPDPGSQEGGASRWAGPVSGDPTGPAPGTPATPRGGGAAVARPPGPALGRPAPGR